MHGLPVGASTAILVTVAIAAVLWFTRRLSLRGQFVALAVAGVCTGFLLLTIVQVPGFPTWLAASLVVLVFLLMPLAVSRFIRSVLREDEAKMKERTDDPAR